MPRSNRPAIRCSAQRSHGRGPCNAYAIRGGTVCVMHGGAAPQVKAAAYRRLINARLERGFERAMEHHREQLAEWTAGRVLATAELMSVEPEQVSLELIGACSVFHSRPDLVTPPKPVWKFDGRHGRRAVARNRP